MVETVGEVLQRPPISYFMTVHVMGEVEGEVEPHFYAQYKKELGEIWRLYDSQGLQLRIAFNKDDDVPRLRTGWMNLREHYGFHAHHQIFFKYLGRNQFQIIPFMNPITPDKFPTWHTKTRALRKVVRFTTTMTDDPELVPYLILPEKMGEYLANTGLDQVQIAGTNGEKHMCELEFQKDPYVVRISRGWPELVGIHGFKVGDRIQFTTSDIYRDHLIWVRSLN